jgi:four helix bundle protein
MHNFKELKIWQRSMDFAVKIYKLTKKFPKEELFGMTMQMRKSSTSIPNNIAEGSGRNTSKDFDHFLAIAYGSSCELETQLIMSERLEFISVQESLEHINELNEIQKMIFNFKLMLQARIENKK